MKKTSPTPYYYYRVTYVDNDTVVRVTRLWHKFQNQNWVGNQQIYQPFCFDSLDGAR